MTASQTANMKSATRAGAVALASLLAAGAWRSLVRSGAPSYDQRVTPAAWRGA